MNNHLLSALFLGISTATALTLTLACPAFSDQTAENRTLTFPPTFSSGTLLLIPTDRGVGREAHDKAEGLAVARGTVKVKVPESKMLLLQLSKQALDNPQCIEQMSSTGIDSVVVSCLSLEDKDDDICNKALQYVPHFKNLQGLDVDRSDTSDAGLAQIKSMPKLKSISAFMTGIKGTCFKDFHYLPELKDLDFEHCRLDKANFGHLAALPHLQTLRVSATGLTDKSLEQLSKSQSLTVLRLMGNPDISDRGMQQLAKIKTLRSLDVRKTSITVAGLEQLKSIPLKRLIVNEYFKEPAKRSRLEKAFPHTDISYGLGGSHDNDDNKVIFGRIH